MRYMIALIMLSILIPFSAKASVFCRAVVNDYDSQVEGNNVQSIQDSGWVKLSPFQNPPGGTAGWFLFADGTRVYAIHNGSTSSYQWTVDMESAVDGDDCDPVMPAPSGQTSQSALNIWYASGYGGGGFTEEFGSSGGNGYPMALIRDSSTSNNYCGPFTDYICVF